MLGAGASQSGDGSAVPPIAATTSTPEAARKRIQRETIWLLDDVELCAEGVGISSRKRAQHIWPWNDINLLVEAIDIFPYGDPRMRTAAWTMVAEQTNVECEDNIFDARRAQERCAQLISAMRAGEMHSLNVSGTKDQYEDREQLLTDLIEKIDNAEDMRRRSAVLEASGSQSRAASIDLNTASSQTGSTSKRRAAEWDMETFLKEDAEARRQEKDRRFELDKRRLALEERRLALEERRTKQMDKLIEQLLKRDSANRIV
ncbi:hypothetical protein HDU86_002379 [Geranomyces michiganensis]|nr:hypothetical protein HDU86_002379 [Geranomyces michiganensis]